MKRNKHIRCLCSALSTFPVPRTETILYSFRFNFICSPFTPSPKFPFSLALIGTELLHSQYRRFPARGQALALCTSQESLLPPDQPTEGNLSLMPETALKKKKRLPVCVIQVLKRSLRRKGHGCLFSIHLCLAHWCWLHQQLHSPWSGLPLASEHRDLKTDRFGCTHQNQYLLGMPRIQYWHKGFPMALHYFI